MSGAEKENAPRLEQEGVQENNGGDRDPCKVKEDIPANGGAGDQNCLLSDPEKVRDALAWLRPAGQWSLHSKANEGPFRGRQFADLGAAARWAGGENAGAATNVYIALADLCEGFTGTKAKDIDVVSSRWLWVDLDPDKKDARPFAVKRAELLARLTTDLPKEVPAPSAIIDSGGGYWGLWRLAAPMDPDEVRLRLKWLAEKMKGDKTTDPSRIIRLPGTVNRPDAAKVAAGQRPALAHFVRRDVVEYTPAAFGGPAVAPAGAPVAEVDVAWGDLPRFGSPHEIEGLSPRIQAVIAQGDDPDKPYASRSHALFAVCCELARAGYTDTQIAGVVTDPNFEVCAYLYDQKGKKLTPAERRMTPKVMASATRQIKNARAKVAEDGDRRGDTEGNSRPVVVVDYNRLHLMLNAAEDALLASGLALYQRAGAVVAPVRHPRGSLRLREVSATAMREMMTTAADFTEEGIDKDGNKRSKPAYPEPHFTQAYVERAAMGTCRLPECNGLVGHPTIRPDGSLLWAEGFDSDTGLIVDYGGVSFPPVPDTPTRDEAMAALAKLKEVIKGFPFVDDASKSVALSANRSPHGPPPRAPPSRRSPEAPTTLRTWLWQRRRWIAGHVVTAIVHLRNPVQTWRDLGPAGSLAVLAQLPAATMCVAAHPVGLTLAVRGDLSGPLGALLLLGYAASVALTWATTRSALTVFLLPAYSALHVAALAMALADLVRCPSAWNKTAHGVAARPAVSLPAQTCPQSAASPSSGVS